MKEIFLAAKYIAIQENSNEITKEHFAKAFYALQIKDHNVKELISKELQTESYSDQEITIKKENLETASKHGVITFSDEVKKIKSLLEENGFTMSSDLVYFPVNKSASLQNLLEVDAIKKNLENEIFSQELAIEAICDKLVEFSYIDNQKAPKGIFLFLGPPATGKTYLAERLVEYMDGYTLEVFDMSNYSSGNQGFALMGLSKGYNNAAEGKLTETVKKHPKSICVFDEIEKAHTEIQNSLLQVMARGKAKDEFSQEEIDFTQSIFIFTSNLGSELYTNSSFMKKMKEDYASAQDIILEAVAREKYATSSGGEAPFLKPEFLSRLTQGETVLFNKLTLEAYCKIAKERFEHYAYSFKNEYNIDIKCDDLDKLILLRVLTFTPLLDARKVRSKLSLGVFDKLTDFIRTQSSALPENLSVRIVLDESVKNFLSEHISDDEEKNSKFIHERFRKNETIDAAHEISFDENNIVLKYTQCSIKKLPKAKDFADEDGSIVFEVPSIAFEDISGHEKAKKRLSEIVGFLKHPQKLQEFDVQSPRGMLLYGPPGTGKTMLAKAFAHEADLPFIATTGSEILNIEKMKMIFKRAKEYAPSIVFIDEIDAIGSRDGSRADIIINQFLTEINGFGDNEDEQIFIISATNLKEKIDPAILRSGRIDLHVKIDTLDKKAREFFIKNILKKPNDGNIDIHKLITFTAGMSGADLEKVNRETSLEVIRKGLDKITEEIIIEQINIVKYGERLTAKSLEKVVESTAYHEAGHAVISKVLMPEVKIEQITVTPRNDALGFVSYNLEDEFGNLTYTDIKNKICVAFAGRMAQLYKYGKEEGLDSGASSDLKMATKYAYYAIANLGMDETIGYISIDGFSKESIIAGITEQEIQKQVKLLLKAQELRTKELVEKNWQSIENVSKVLIEDEFIDEDQFNKILK